MYIIDHPKFLIKSPSKAIKDYLRAMFDPKELDKQLGPKEKGGDGWYEKKYYRSTFGRTWGIINEHCKKNLEMPDDNSITALFWNCYNYVRSINLKYEFSHQNLPIPHNRLEYINNNEQFFFKKKIINYFYFLFFLFIFRLGDIIKKGYKKTK
jgi:hypothetical protein